MKHIDRFLALLALLAILVTLPGVASRSSAPAPVAAPFVVTDAAHPKTFTGWGPRQLWSAYKLPSAYLHSHGTVAIVDAYDDPTAYADMRAYRRRYKLPACSQARGCFTKLSQNGDKKYPAPNADWGVEESLDVQMVSAICPTCHIVLVEAASASFEDLATADLLASRLHPDAISNSWGAPEPPAPKTAQVCAPGVPDCMTQADVLTQIALLFDFPGIATVFSAGDSGYGPSMPADSPWVISVGGTSLRRAQNARGWQEQAWEGTGSGCSQIPIKMPWQKDALCKDRTISDVSFDADPYTGVAIFDSTSYYSTRHQAWKHGWLVVGGTSVGAPAIAALYGLAHNARFLPSPGAYLYAHPHAFTDITSGTNAPGMKGYHKRLYLIQALPGYDGPTGLGTPKGLKAF